MASKFTYDTANRRIILNAGVTELEAKSEFYSAAKYDWLTDDSLNKFRFPILSIGGQGIGSGKTISPYYSLAYGWRLQFPMADMTVNILGNIITVEGDSPLVDSPGSYHHVAQYTVSADSQTVGGNPITSEDIWGYQDDGVLTMAQKMQVFGAVLAGKAIITGDNIIFRNIEDTRDTVDATTADGERTSVTTNVV